MRRYAASTRGAESAGGSFFGRGPPALAGGGTRPQSAARLSRPASARQPSIGRETDLTPGMMRRPSGGDDEDEELVLADRSGEAAAEGGGWRRLGGGGGGGGPGDDDGYIDFARRSSVSVRPRLSSGRSQPVARHER